MGWWTNPLVSRAKDWMYARLDPSQTPGDITPQRISPNTSYISIFLQSMRIVNVRKGLNKFFGTVHSYISLPYLSGQQAQFNVVTTPGQLRGVDATHIDQVISMEQRLLGPVPYRGGDINLEVGLFSIQEAALADSFLSFLEKASGLAGVSFIATALPYADLVKEGVNLLVGGADDTLLEIGLARNFAQPETGYYVVMRAQKTEIDVRQLRIDPTDYRLLDGQNEPISDFPYMVLKILSSKERDAWFEVPELAAAYGALQADIRKDNRQAIQESLTVFRRVALTCPDLLEADADKLVEKVNSRVNAIIEPIPTRGLSDSISKAITLPSLRELSLYE